MNVQTNEQRQKRSDCVIGTDARIEADDITATKRITKSTRSVETLAEGTTPLIKQDYDRAIEIVSQLTGASVEQLTNKHREDTMALGRMCVAWWLYEVQEYTRHDISKVFCRDRSTIYYYCRKFPELLSVSDKKAQRLHNAFLSAIAVNTISQIIKPE